MNRTTPFLLAAVLTFALGAPQAASAAASRAEYAAQAEPICADASADIRALTKSARRADKRGYDKQAGRKITQIGAVFTRSISDVRSIAPPPGDETTINTWLDKLHQIGVNTMGMGRAQRHHKFGTRYRLYTANLQLGTDAVTLVRDFGFHACIGEQLPAFGPLPAG